MQRASVGGTKVAESWIFGVIYGEPAFTELNKRIQIVDNDFSRKARVGHVMRCDMFSPLAYNKG
jgi:hypothetical protein